MSLLPSRPDAEPADDAGPRVIGVDSEDADEVLSALSSGTARQVLASLHDDPAPPSELADRVDTSLQNAQYHLEKLENAGAVEVVDTAYSAKGREMDVYAPADQPLVIFAGDEDRGSTLRQALARLLGSVGILALASLAVQSLFGRGGPFGGTVFETGGGADGGSGGGAGAAPSPTPTQTATETVAAGGDGGDAGGAPPPGDATQTVAPQTTAEPAMTQSPPATTGGEQAITDTVTATTTDAVRTTAEAAGRGGLPPGLMFFAGGLFVLAVVAVVLYVGRA
jgi:DNA-binding transcriptional ArsR family regulator